MHERTWPGKLPLPIPYVIRAVRAGLRPGPGAAGGRARGHRRHGGADGGRSPYDWAGWARTPEPGGDRGGPGHARGRHAIVFCSGGTRCAGPRPRRGWTFTSACRTRRSSCGPRATAARTRSSSGRSSIGDPRPLADRRGFRRPPAGGTHVAGARLTVFQVAEGDF
jgi:hypothetical protein